MAWNAKRWSGEAVLDTVKGTMGPNLRQLLAIGTCSLCVRSREWSASEWLLVGFNYQLQEMLSSKNGFYAFEGALHVFPHACASGGLDLEAWNRPDGWRRGYAKLVDGYTFFAEDVFGCQFGIFQGTVARFDPESGELEPIAGDLDSWAKLILGDYAVETGYRAAHEWQLVHGQLLPGQRLLPRIPLIFEGSYTNENLYAVDAVKGMELRASLWRQTKDLPDGAKIQMIVQRKQ